MEITFDISKDEVPIFLAEVDEHLQVLDNSLLGMERNDSDPELMQTIFRSAHTIKGMSGMIGHRRMTDVTHALETVLDGVRKGSIQVSSQLVNSCLDAVDCLRLLRDEVVTLQVSDIDIDTTVSSLKNLIRRDEPIHSPEALRNCDGKAQSTSGQELTVQNDLQNVTLKILVRIDPASVASAARAFQLMMELQDLGEIQSMTPTQEQIEAATPVHDFAAELVTENSIQKVGNALSQISEVDEISINGRIIFSHGSIVPERTGFPEKRNEPSKTEIGTASPAAGQQARDKRAPESVGRRITDLTLRMNVERVDNLMNLVGELITDRNHLQQLRGQLAAETNVNGNFEQLFETITHLGRITDQLQEEVMSIRMLPIGSVFSKFPRLVHDMSRRVGKLINVTIQGEETEMDRSLIDEIYDPLIHLIRNSADHGIEPPEDRLAVGKPERGTITLTARHEQGRIIITVGDDGRGIDREKLRKNAVQKGLISAEEAAALNEEQALDLMFFAGLSTVEKVTEFSGRGVGLDIVKTNIQRINGSIAVETWLGKGTQFQIVLPLTLAIVPSLLVRVQKSTFAIPMVMISETVRLQKLDIKSICQKPVILLRGSVLPLVHLSDVFGFKNGEEERKHFFAVVIQFGKERFGLIVDSLIGEEEVVVKPLGAFIGDIPGISSATILGNGQVALIVEVFNLFKLVGA
jgi:two-component system chemotaxis sensor kinase CheA